MSIPHIRYMNFDGQDPAMGRNGGIVMDSYEQSRDYWRAVLDDEPVFRARIRIRYRPFRYMWNRFTRWARS